MQYRPDPLGGRGQSDTQSSSHERSRDPLSSHYGEGAPNGAGHPYSMGPGFSQAGGQTGGPPMGPMGMMAMVQQYLDQHGGAEQNGGQSHSGRPVDQDRPQHPAYNRHPSQPAHQSAHPHHPYGGQSGYSSQGLMNQQHQAGPSNYARHEFHSPQLQQTNQHGQGQGRHVPHSQPTGHLDGYPGYAHVEASSGSRDHRYTASPMTNGGQRMETPMQEHPAYAPSAGGYAASARSSHPPSYHPVQASSQSLGPGQEPYGRQASSGPYFPPHMQNQQAPHDSRPTVSPTSSMFGRTNDQNRYHSNTQPLEQSRPTSPLLSNRSFGPQEIGPHAADTSLLHSLPQSISPTQPGFSGDDREAAERVGIPSAKKRKIAEGSAEREGSHKLQDGEAKDANGVPTFVACTKCRSRKIKCGGQRPACVSCLKKGLDCCYDAVIKRRGPDKNPGGRVKNRDGKDSKDYKSRVRQPGESKSGDDAGANSSDSRGIRYDSSLPPSMAGGSVPPAGYLPQYAPKPYLNHPGAMNGHGPMGEWNGVPDMHVQQSIKMPWLDTISGAPMYPPHAQAGLHVHGMQSGHLETSHPTHRQPLPVAEPPLTFEEARRVLEPANHRAENGSSARSDAWTVSPTGGSKMGMRDLVSGYHDIMSQAEMITRSRESAGDGDGVDQIGDTENRKSAEPNLWLERLPDVAYARDSDWMWMTGLFSNNPAEGLQAIHREVRDFFGLNFSWFSFFHKSLFLARLHHPEERLRIQPSLILAMFSVTTLAKSAREKRGGEVRKRALMYADAAQSMLQQSIISQSMDPTMAQAALILTAFEAYPHDQHASHRFRNAVQNLDTIIQAFQLLAMDVNDERASIFIPNQVPLLANDSGTVLPVRSPKADTSPTDSSAEGQLRARWAPEPAWPLEWSVAQIRQDEMRRMCWIASSIAGHLSQFGNMTGEQPLDLYMAKPENYAMLFTAEVLLIDKDVEAGKTTIWALFNRVTLMWHYINRVKQSKTLDPVVKLALAGEIWREADRIEKAMFSVEMDGGRSMKWQATDWLLNLRLLATDNFRMLPQMFGDDGKRMGKEYAKRWLGGQAAVAKMLMGPGGVSGQQDVAFIEPRSFFVWSLMSQAHTAIDLYRQDTSTTEALEVAGELMRSIERVAELWPTETLVAYLERFKEKYIPMAQDKIVPL